MWAVQDNAGASRILASLTQRNAVNVAPVIEARVGRIMDRIKDYIVFSAWFSGLGYMALWPVLADDASGMTMGAAIFCRDGSFGLFASICNSAAPLRLPPGLHALGFVAALFVWTRLLLFLVSRSRQALRKRRAASVAVAESLPAEAAPPPRAPCLRYPTVPARSHFGLRGVLR
jgi:hypothetical protein